ncbi:MAG: NUDIX hydrolase [Sphaerotilus sp.]|nr:NUDIX hydrolase [Sphaerotilus sp.]
MDEKRFCSHCGAPTVREVPPGDHLTRQVCPACHAIHYENPRIVVGCVAEHEGRILICRRAIEPRRGYWTIPAGFMENGETLADGAARECQEEALADVEIGSLLAVLDIPGAHQVHVFFRARMRDGTFGAGPESLESRLVDEDQIPWGDFAFPSTRYALQQYLADRVAGREDLHRTVLSRRHED